MAQFGWFSLCLMLGIAGCTETYCQSGPKYGSQCYSINDVELQRSMVEPPPSSALADPRSNQANQSFSTQPSPGCALLTPSGIYMTPQNPRPVSAPSSPYLMSGACGSRLQPVHAVH